MTPGAAADGAAQFPVAESKVSIGQPLHTMPCFRTASTSRSISSLLLFWLNEAFSQIGRGCQRVGILGSKNPLAHCKHLAPHLLRLSVLSFALEG